MKQNSMAVIPIAVLVLILNFFKPVNNILLFKFLLGSLGLIVGLSIFLTGVELSISKIGSMIGDYVGNLNHIIKVIIFGIFIGFIVSMAEPDLLILANEIKGAISISSQLIVIIISIGVGLMLSIGLFRIFKDINMSNLMIGIYSIIFALMLINDDMGHAISFDASGATTGAMTTPFIIALGLGISRLKGEDEGEEDSFGLVGITSTGPIIFGLLITMSSNNKNFLIENSHNSLALVSAIKSSLFAIIPIIVVFFIMNFLIFKKNKLGEIKFGLLYTFIGLVIFLTSVEGGFMELARQMGENYSNSKILPILGFFLGLLVVLAEPAVYILSEQVEDVTGGSIHKKSILKALSIGVALAVMLAMIRIKVEGFKLWMVIIPGLLISLYLSRKVPKIFVGIAFDSGAVASGPMTATFILAFCQGVAGNIKDGFGVISFVALVPIITIMILATFYKEAVKE